jgi:hypothetical protein
MSCLGWNVTGQPRQDNAVAGDDLGVHTPASTAAITRCQKT